MRLIVHTRSHRSLIVSMPRVTLIFSLLVASVLFGPWSGFAQAQIQPTAGSPQPMRFEWMREGLADTCGGPCREWISATGSIVDTTPRDFETFAKGRDVRGAIVVLNSIGGVVGRALELGREFRRLGVTTAVGSTTEEGEQRVTISPRAACNSMCVFLLMGGVKRYVPEEARILVHQIWPSRKREDATAATYTAGDMVRTQRTLGEIAQYVVEMGANIELFRIATRVPPWEALRPLTRDELRRLRAHNADDVFGALPYSGSIPGTPPPTAPVATPAAPGWALINKEGQHALVRRHPLTIEGEQIGVFEISFRCGETPGEYRVEYVEKRIAQTSQDIRLDGVGIGVEKERSLLKVRSSKLGEPPTQVDSVARGIVSTKFIEVMGSSSNAPLVVATSTTNKSRTTTLIGHSGLPQNLQKMTASCSQN